MSLTLGCLNMQSLIQKLVYFPVHLDPSSLHMKRQQLHKTSSKLQRFQKLQWILNSYVLIPVVGLSFFRIQWLLSKWEENKEWEQLGVYILIGTMATVGHIAYQTFERHSDEMCYVITERFKILRVTPTGSPFIKRPPEIGELVLYMIGIGVLIFFPIAFSAMIILRDYGPLQLIIYKILDILQQTWLSKMYLFRFVIKIFSALCIGSVVLHGSTVVLAVDLEIIMLVEATQILSFNLCGRSKVGLWKIFKGSSFTSTLKLFQILRILMFTENIIISNYLVALTGMGVLAATCGGYIMLMFYSEMPLIMYLPFSLNLPLCIAVNFLLNTLAAIPYQNGRRFRQYWKYYLKTKHDKLQLRSCPSIGYSFGPVRLATRQTALVIADVIMNGVATLALLRLEDLQIVG